MVPRLSLASVVPNTEPVVVVQWLGETYMGPIEGKTFSFPVHEAAFLNDIGPLQERFVAFLGRPEEWPERTSMALIAARAVSGRGTHARLLWIVSNTGTRSIWEEPISYGIPLNTILVTKEYGIVTPQTYYHPRLSEEPGGPKRLTMK